MVIGMDSAARLHKLEPCLHRSLARCLWVNDLTSVTVSSSVKWGDNKSTCTF